jgi:MoaA/NifB/PqqE/SkfB family radical SAM enzyme
MSSEKVQLTDVSEPLVNDKGYRIIQIHPSLKCNLTCLHCYSSSAPQLKYELDLGLLCRFLEQARDAGYNAISLSGGEPFLYSHFQELLQYSKSLGYFNSVTTNGTLLKGRSKNIDALQYIDLLAFSIDGQPDRHNFMRNSPTAFERLQQGIETAREHIKNIGFIHTITPSTFPSLLWLAEFAVNAGAKLLQLHPLESMGRGRNLYESLALDQENLQRLYILCHYLQQKYRGQVLLELDLLHRDHILQHPKSIYAQRPPEGYRQLTDCMRELIVDERGDLLPVSHGFSRHYRIGNIRDGISLKNMQQDFLTNRYPLLQELFDDTFGDIFLNEEVELLNWAELIVHNSRKSGVTA